ncbi:uncharacterized protein E0L32_011126 [Thyridium curvatum]|uniref:Uncharacterized protein n=1 Tax=Thyridium curvatum TaxID=1093900 RepID=A0A507AQ61_9PEZI|nr:uncharacterized protein E0L32_011126 [Thyridium curvatum]TPX06981.1 hypothetical protein E0L32_011126 [Thyridium curvatum]
MAPPSIPAVWEIPKLRASFGFEDDHQYVSDDGLADTEFFDVKFYPYNPVGSNPIFAAVSKKHVVVCRLSSTKEKDVNPCELLKVIRDDDEEALNCSCTWTKDAATETAYLCVAGRDAKVKVYNVREGKLVTTLVGHGGEINDLATSPANPQLIASASDDTTVRIWSLAAEHAKQPCVCLLGGEGHSWNLLSVAFHDSGRYVLSAGHDQIINLWTIPDIPSKHMDTPMVVHYPHFSTSEIHSGLIDCVAFYGDCILSRACHEECIVLWRIEGFSSEDPPPSPDIAPTAHDTSKLTRSAFTPLTSPSGQAQYTRLMQFHTPGCGVQFFMRFSMLHVPGQHPVLGFCNAQSKIFFWDMARFTTYHDFMAALQDPRRDPNTPVARPPWLKPIVPRKRGPEPSLNRRREASAQDSAVSGNVSTPDPEKAEVLFHGYNRETIDDWEKKYSMDDPHALIRAHKFEVLSGFSLVGRQVAWSPEGDWCVIVGSNNRAVIMQRWARDGSHADNVDDSMQ